MEKPKKLTTKKLVLIIAAVFLVCGSALGILAYVRNGVKKVASKEEYEYINPDETKAEPDEGFVIDGVLDEKQYQECEWLYLHNDNGGSGVDVAMTSYYGKNGMYIVYDVSEDTPIYVNLDRKTYLNSGVEMYLALNGVTSMKSNGIFEIDLLPTGDMSFRQRTGRNNWVNAASTGDIMSYLGATTKGGPVNTEECSGYYLELFIPWAYMNKLGMDASAMQNDFIYINPIHITSYNLTGTSTSVDRYWYSFATQLGGDGWNDVTQYFRFGERGVIGTVPITLVDGDHYTIKGSKSVIPGMMTTVTITPEEGYALNSILVNGEEYIKSVSYNEDGSVTLRVRGTADGLNISATAEVVTAGNKTLRGTVKVHKLGGDDLKGVSLSYLGPTGEKPITFDSNGNFELKDLAQGYYKITAEKDGYESIIRGIKLNRDIETELVLEYQMFQAETGYNWILDDQNDGILSRFGGSGAILSVDSYKKFAVEANFKYDAKLAELSDGDTFLQQRSGIRIKFSNDKYWRVDVMYSNGKYRVQYAKQSSGSVFDWKTIYTMTDEEIAQYKSEDGIKLSILRDGQYANVYLGSKLIAVEKLDDEYKNHTAQIGFEAWVANQEVENIKYNISNNFKQDITNYYFAKPANWDISRQYEGIISLPNGGNGGYLAFAKQYENLDLTLTIKDYDDPEKTNARTDVLFVFENGAHVSFGVNVSSKGKGRIQALNLNADDGKQIYNKYTNFGNLTEEETAQYQGEGIKFRVVRIGTELSLYIGDRLVNVVDLTNNKSGVTDTMKATVTIRHYDDEGVKVEIPFSVNETFEMVTITSVEGKLGKVVAQKKKYFVGDTVVLSGAGNDGYYCTGMKVNGKDVTLSDDGTYTFKATEKNYTVEGTFDERVFEDNSKWNLLKQNAGVVSLPDGGNGGNLQFYKKYTDMDLTLKVRDYDDEADKAARTDVLFVFENGAHVSFGINCSSSGACRIQSMNLTNDDGKQIYNKWTNQGNLTAEETALYVGEGIDFRIVRIGTELTLYIGDRQLNVCDLTNNDSGVTADMKATVYLRHYDDAGVQVDIPFEVTDELEKVTVTIKDSENGTISTDKKNYIVGENIILTGEGVDDYYCIGMKINGTNIEAANGQYTLTATETSYTVEGIFSNSLFVETSGWDLSKEKEGIVSLTNGGKSTIDLRSKYTDIDLTFKVRDYADSANAAARTDVRFFFDTNNDGKYSNDVVISVGVNGKKIESITSGITKKQHRYGNLTNEEYAQYTGDGIDLRIVRQGTLMFICIGDRIVCDPIDLTTYHADATAGTGATGVVADTKALITLRHWDDAGVQVDIPFVISDELEKIFNETDGWDVTNQYVGSISMPDGGKYTIDFIKKYTDVDLTIKVRDYADSANKVARTDVRFFFDTNNDGKYSNDAVITFGVNGKKVESITGGITKKQHRYGTLTDEEYAKYTSEGVDLRIVRKDTNIYLYIDGRQVCDAIDLTTYYEGGTGNGATGVAADTKAMLTLRHWDDAGVQVDIPFSITEEVEKVTISDATKANAGGTIETMNNDYFVGDTITFTATGTGNYYCTGMKVNGESVTLDEDSYTLVATEKSYTVEGTFSNSLFVETSGWDLSREEDGIVSLTNGGKSTIDLRNKYTDVDLTFTVRDYADSANAAARTDVRFFFDTNNDGKYSNDVVITVGVNGKKVESITSGITKKQHRYATMTDEEYAQYTSTGIDLRIVRIGTMLYIRIGDRIACDPIDLATYHADATAGTGATGVAADTNALITLRHWDDAGVQVDIPFAVTNPIEKAFNETSGWNVASQYAGVISLTNGGKSTIDLADKYTDVDLTLKVRDYADSANSVARNDVRFFFDTNNDGKYSNDVVISFGVNGKKIESITLGITKKQHRYGNLTDEEYAKYTSTGIDFRIVRKDTTVYLYIEGRQVCDPIDLTTYYSGGNGTGATGVAADTKSLITLRHWDDAGVQVDFPFTVTDDVQLPVSTLGLQQVWRRLTSAL